MLGWYLASGQTLMNHQEPLMLLINCNLMFSISYVTNGKLTQILTEVDLFIYYRYFILAAVFEINAIQRYKNECLQF